MDPKCVQGLGSAFLGTDGINRSCGTVIQEVKKGTKREFAVILLHARSAILLACVAQFEFVPNKLGLDDQLIESAPTSGHIR